MSGFADFLAVCYQDKPPKPTPRRAKRSTGGTAHTVENVLVYREERERVKELLRKQGKV